jgi:glycosyltransferase involved in cell wall biosynthesis
MNAAIILSFHGSIEKILEKTGGNTERISEFLLIDKYSKKFDNVFIFSHDKKKFDKYLPRNSRQVRLHNRLVYIFLGWIFVLFYSAKNNIKIIYVECGPALPPIFLVNKLTKAKTFLNYDNTWYITVKNRAEREIIRMGEKFLLKFVNYFVVGSREIRRFVGNYKNILPVKKGIIVDAFNPATNKNEIYKKTRGKTIVFIGRLSPIKDPLTAIKAYKIAKKEVKNLNLMMCGDGELMEECRNISDKNVIFLKFTKDIPSILSGADIFILTSTYDASPRSLMEAMCMAKPCIATNVGGVPDYLDSDCGILIEPKNPEKLAEKIVFLINNPKIARLKGLKAREKILKEHNLDKNIDKALEMLIKAVK